MAQSSPGIVFYHGPSMIDGKPIVAIATLSSKNPKTGPMIQTWIMSTELPPHKAIKTGKDYSVCGDCKLRPSESGVCYVLTFQGPRQIFETWKNGRYRDCTASSGHSDTAMGHLVTGRAVRMGAYGDPAAVPQERWNALLQQSIGHTGYTHQWKHGSAEWLKGYVMASCDNTEERLNAGRDGWSTFSIAPMNADIPANLHCPAQRTENGVQCINCLRCNGDKKRSIYVHAHGTPGLRFKGDE